MQKTYCDRCGEEIEDFVSRHQVTIRDTLFDGGALYEFDLCKKCDKELSDWLHDGNNQQEKDHDPR